MKSKNRKKLLYNNLGEIHSFQPKAAEKAEPGGSSRKLNRPNFANLAPANGVALLAAFEYLLDITVEDGWKVR